MPEGKRTTEHDAANAAIGQLRGAAVALQELGDEVLRLLYDKAQGLMSAAAVADQHAEWTELLEDFRRGVRGPDELIERTVGKR